MGHWNHRVVKETLQDGSSWYTVREVFYNDDNSIYAYTEDAMDASAENLDDLREYLEWMMKALDQPILIDGEVEFVDHDDEEE